MSHSESQRLTDHPGKNRQREVYDKLFQPDNYGILLPGEWERLPQALHTTQERCNILEADPVHVNTCDVSVAVRICNSTDRSAEI